MSCARHESSRVATGGQMATEASACEPQPGIGARWFATGHVGASSECVDVRGAARWPTARMRAR
eukprot:2742318-Alexandrium_andersonii.AAC.1